MYRRGAGIVKLDITAVLNVPVVKIGHFAHMSTLYSTDAFALENIVRNYAYGKMSAKLITRTSILEY